jgi:hypothetical protein
VNSRPQYTQGFTAQQRHVLQYAADWPIPVLTPGGNWLKTLAEHYSRGFRVFRLTPGTYRYDGSWEFGPGLVLIGTHRLDVVLWKPSGELRFEANCRLERMTIRLATDCGVKASSFDVTAGGMEFHDCIIDLAGTNCHVSATGCTFVGCRFAGFADVAVYQSGDWLRLIDCAWDIALSGFCARLVANSQAVGCDCQWAGEIKYEGVSAATIALAGNMATQIAF